MTYNYKFIKASETTSFFIERKNMRKFLIAFGATVFATSALASHTTSTTLLGIPVPNVNAIVDPILGKDPPQGNCYSGYHTKVTKSFNARGKYLGKTVTCEEDD